MSNTIRDLIITDLAFSEKRLSEVFDCMKDGGYTVIDENGKILVDGTSDSIFRVYAPGATKEEQLDLIKRHMLSGLTLAAEIVYEDVVEALAVNVEEGKTTLSITRLGAGTATCQTELVEKLGGVVKNTPGGNARVTACFALKMGGHVSGETKSDDLSEINRAILDGELNTANVVTEKIIHPFNFHRTDQI